MNTGSILSGRPSSRLGQLRARQRQQEPAVVRGVLDDRDPIGGAKQWTAGFLPATYQGTQFRTGDRRCST